MDGSIELRLQDYRQLSATYDHIVSIEMLEAVGEEHWETCSHAALTYSPALVPECSAH